MSERRLCLSERVLRSLSLRHVPRGAEHLDDVSRSVEHRVAGRLHMFESSVGQENPVLVFDVDLLADCVRTDAVHALAIVGVKSLVDDLSGR
jgi:hypothetical protein